MSAKQRSAGSGSGGQRIRRRHISPPPEGSAKRRHNYPRQEDLENLVANMKALRRARGWSQEILGVEADIGRTHVGKLEAKEIDPRLSTLGAIATALEVTTPDLLQSTRLRKSGPK